MLVGRQDGNRLAELVLLAGCRLGLPHVAVDAICCHQLQVPLEDQETKIVSVRPLKESLPDLSLQTYCKLSEGKWRRFVDEYRKLIRPYQIRTKDLVIRLAV